MATGVVDVYTRSFASTISEQSSVGSGRFLSAYAGKMFEWETHIVQTCLFCHHEPQHETDEGAEQQTWWTSTPTSEHPTTLFLRCF